MFSKKIAKPVKQADIFEKGYRLCINKTSIKNRCYGKLLFLFYYSSYTLNIIRVGSPIPSLKFEDRITDKG